MNKGTIFKDKKSDTHYYLYDIDSKGAYHLLTCNKDFSDIAPGTKFGQVDWTLFSDPDIRTPQYAAIQVAKRIMELGLTHARTVK